jgi:hypothetical protein
MSVFGTTHAVLFCYDQLVFCVRKHVDRFRGQSWFCEKKIILNGAAPYLSLRNKDGRFLPAP